MDKINEQPQPGDSILSVRQPWAHAIIFNGKDIENRNWYCQYRGKLWIHAGKSKIEMDTVWTEFEDGSIVPRKDECSFGAISGYVTMIDCRSNDKNESVWSEPSGFGFLLANAVAVKPILYRGELGIFKYKEQSNG